MSDPSMNDGATRLAEMFAAARAEQRSVLLPYLTAGLPDPESSVHLFVAMAEAGTDGFEIGIPYADPLMDGPVIQEAGTRALEAGMTVDRALEIVSAVSSATAKPCLVMTYVNPVLHRGSDAFFAAVAAAGGAGVILADLPADEASPFLESARTAGLGMALFAAPTTDDARLAMIGSLEPAFIYGVAELGVTGERTVVSRYLETLAARVRAVSDAPLVAGVGISTPAQAAAAAQVADGVIVGSALVRRVLAAPDPETAEAKLRLAVGELAAALRGSGR
jgi:tryptophan synthase alpha chain